MRITILHYYDHARVGGFEMSKLNIDQQTIKELFSNKRADFLIPDLSKTLCMGGTGMSNIVG